MALPLKSGADLYTQELLRARLHNYDGDLSEYGVGSIYYNTTSGLNTSDRIRYRGRNAWHSVANLEDIARLEELIAELGDVSGGNITDLLNRIKDAEGDIEAVEGRVKTIEDDYLTDADKNELSALITTLQGYFSNGVANDAAKLGGQLPSYYAQSSVLGQLRTEFDALYKTLNDDTEGVINTWQEVVDFVNEYSGSEDLSTILAGMNTQIADRYTRGEVDTKLSAYRLLTNGTFDVLVNANKGIETDEITIGGIKLSVVEGQLKIDGDAFATGQLASGGIGEAGSGSGASGIVILEDWSKYDDSVAQVVGAVLGKDLHDRLGVAESTLESLVGKATNVSVVQTLTSGKEIGAITIDGVATKLYAPATYAWGEITSKPTTLAGYGITDAVALQGKRNDLLHGGNEFSFVSEGFSGEVWFNYRTLNAADGNITLYNFGTGFGFNFSKLRSSGYVVYGGTSSQFLKADGSLDSNAYLPLSGGTITGGFGSFAIMRDGEKPSSIRFVNTSTALGAIGFNASSSPCIWDGSGTNERRLLHEGNYSSILDDVYFKKSGGTITSAYNEPLVIHNPNTESGSYIVFKSGDEKKAYFGYSGGGFAFIQYGDSSVLGVKSNGVYYNNKIMLHEGNFNSYAPTLTGTGASGTWGIDISGSAAMLGGYYAARYFRRTDDVISSSAALDAISKNFVGVMQTSNYTPIEGMYKYGQLIQFADKTGTTQIYVADYNGGVWIRNSWLAQTAGFAHEWKQLAYTTSNVASATKLATARSFWGNLFDGTGDVTGGIAFSSVQKISWHSNADSYYICSSVFTGATNPSLEFCAWGGHYFSSQGVTRLVINQAGNVTIGSSDYAQQNCKLFVDGAINVGTYGALHRDANNHLWVNYGGSVAEKNLIICGYNTSFYYGKSSNYQSAMFINSSGNVGLGTTNPTHKLHVNGAASIGTSIPNNALMLDVRGKMRISAGYLYDGYTEFDDRGSKLVYVSEKYGWTNGTYAYKTDGTMLAAFTMNGSPNAISDFRFRFASDVSFKILPSGVEVPTNKNLKIGDATLSWDSTSNALKVDKDFYSDGQVSSGGVAEEGTGGAVGGSGLERVVFTIPANTITFDCVHNLGTREISVAIYEEGNDYQQILTDVYLDSTNIARVVFGSATDVAHKVVIIG